LTLGLSTAAGAAPAGDAERLRLNVDFDNVGGRGGLATGWGYACLLEASGNTLLFDTGADGVLLLASAPSRGALWRAVVRSVRKRSFGRSNRATVVRQVDLR
jgi:hypothetical protein